MENTPGPAFVWDMNNLPELQPDPNFVPHPISWSSEPGSVVVDPNPPIEIDPDNMPNDFLEFVSKFADTEFPNPPRPTARRLTYPETSTETPTRDESPRRRIASQTCQILTRPNQPIVLPGNPFGPSKIIEGGKTLLEWVQPQFTWRNYKKELEFPGKTRLRWAQKNMRKGCADPPELHLQFVESLWSDGEQHHVTVTVGDYTVPALIPAPLSK